MKIQLKTALLRHFRSDIAALQSEKLVFASCQHPFIVSMEYSFQTEGLVFIVLDLVTGGDLHQVSTFLLFFKQLCTYELLNCCTNPIESEN